MASVIGASEDVNNNVRDVLDITNMFHWCPAPSFDSVLLVHSLLDLSLVHSDRHELLK